MGSIWEGERVRLRGIEPGDWEAFMEFDSESDDVRSGGMLFQPRSAEGYRRWVAERVARGPQAGVDDFDLAVESVSEGCLVGSLGTHATDRRAEFMGGRYHDEVLLGITVEEFTAAHALPDVGGGQEP